VQARSERLHPAKLGAGVAMPAARKILEEKGVAAADVAGSGRGGRVTKADALAAQQPLTQPVRSRGGKPVRRRLLRHRTCFAARAAASAARGDVRSATAGAARADVTPAGPRRRAPAAVAIDATPS
jgi:pyruvate/2-oxoglutarate dehydrogenase complex dihydrolipoamide acyltransferase (E2) component